MMTDCNSHNNMPDKKRIKLLIDRYFDATASLEEEAELRHAVASCNDAEFDEIRAVLGFMAVKRGKQRKINRRHSMLTASVAAAAVVAVVAFIGLGDFGSGDVHSPGTCYAMVNGSRIDDEAQVLSLMQAGLSDICSEASDANGYIESQFNELRNSINDSKQ